VLNDGWFVNFTDRHARLDPGHPRKQKGRPKGRLVIPEITMDKVYQVRKLDIFRSRRRAEESQTPLQRTRFLPLFFEIGKCRALEDLIDLIHRYPPV